MNSSRGFSGYAETDTCAAWKTVNHIFVSLNCHFNNLASIIDRQSSLKQSSAVELLVIGNECSVLLLLFSRLNMDHFSFIFSLLLIVSVTTTTYGSVIKGNNPNGEVSKELTCVIALDKISVCNLNGVSLEIPMAFVFFLSHE